ncbi:MAG TPA: hypothetical protein VN512_13020 [Clostridia bacterium]|nr:hypothetical protein [Clostridia bacterium]
MDYSKLAEITVKSQAALDMIPADFAGRIYIEFGTWNNRAVVNKRYGRSVMARGNSSVVAWENSSVVARGNSSVVAWENSSVEARGNSSVEARGNSSVVASANAQIVDRLNGGRIEITGNARIVYMPKTIHEFMDFYGIKHNKKTATFFKAVMKDGDLYRSSYKNAFTYSIGETKIEYCDPDVSVECGSGLHIAHLAWALDFGRDWSNLAILEVETDIDKIILPTGTDGKVRTSELKVLREVPLDECGVYGKILAKRRQSNGN